MGAAAIFGGQGTPEEADNSKGFETYGESDKNTVCLPRQELPRVSGCALLAANRGIEEICDYCFTTIGTIYSI